MEAKQEKEGRYLLGQPTFRQLENGRFQCVETGHELPTHMKKSYADTKHCRLGLIDAAFVAKKPPLNMFSQDPASRSKLICKLTGDIVNKTEEHIWKHINGRRFLNMLEKKEIEKQTPNAAAAAAMVVEKSPQKTKKKKSKSSKLKSKLKGKEKQEDIEEKDSGAEMQDSSEKDESGDFWMPDVGERWDFDNGADRWVSGSESESESDGQVNEEDENETDDGDDVVVANADEETLEISKRAKRMCIEVGPSNLPPKKKKKKTTK